MDDVLDWLLAGDPAVVWQVQRDLLGQSWHETRARVAHEGWGAELLGHRRPNATWPGWYAPKWTSTFYSLQLLQTLGVPAPETVEVCSTGSGTAGCSGPGRCPTTTSA